MVYLEEQLDRIYIQEDIKSLARKVNPKKLINVLKTMNAEKIHSYLGKVIKPKQIGQIENYAKRNVGGYQAEYAKLKREMGSRKGSSDVVKTGLVFGALARTIQEDIAEKGIKADELKRDINNMFVKLRKLVQSTMSYTVILAFIYAALKVTSSMSSILAMPAIMKTLTAGISSFIAPGTLFIAKLFLILLVVYIMLTILIAIMNKMGESAESLRKKYVTRS